MYKLEMPVVVNLADEIEAMVQFVENHWDPVPDLAALFQDIQVQAKHAVRFWFESARSADYLHKQLERRREVLAAAYSEDKLNRDRYDHCALYLQDLCLASYDLENIAKDFDGRWDFSEQTTRVHYQMLAKYPELQHAKPKGWAELAQGYSDFDGMAEYCKQQQKIDAAEFQGANTDSAAASGFHGRVVLPYVMYDEKCQGRKAPYTLVSSAFAHFMAIHTYTQTQTFVAGLKELTLPVEAPAMVFDLKLTSGNPLVSAVLDIVVHKNARDDAKFANEPRWGSEAAFLAAVERHRVHELKSQEEKDAIVAANMASIKDFFASLRNDEPDLAYEEQRRREVAYSRERLEFHLGQVEAT